MWSKQILTDKFQFPVHWHNTSLHPFPLFLAKYKEIRGGFRLLYFLLNIPVPLKRNTFQVPLDLNAFHIYTKMNKPDVNTQQQTLYFFTLKLSQITWHSDHILSTKWQDKDTSIQFKYIFLKSATR